MKPTVIGIIKDADGISNIIASMLAYIGINGYTNANYKDWKFEYDNHMIDDCDPNHTIYDVNQALESMTQNLFGVNFAIWRNNTKKYDIRYVYDIKQNIAVNADRIDNISQHILPDDKLTDINWIKGYFINTDKNNCVTIKGLCNITKTLLNETIESNFLYKKLFREIERDIKFYPFKVITGIDANDSNLVINWIENANSFTGEVLQINLFNYNKPYDKEYFNLFYQILNYYKQWI
jgi:hypothetical protein